MKRSNISFCEFCDNFSESERDTFSYEGKKALFDYLEEYEENTGEEIELDIVELCCEYSEYGSVEEYLKDYTPSEINNEKDEEETEEEFKERLEEETQKYLEENTQLILLGNNLDDGFIIQNF